MRGYVFQDRQDYESALRSFDRALDAYRGADDPDGIVAVSTLRASIFDALADYPHGWAERTNALAGLNRVGDPRAQYTTLSEAARASLRDGFKAASLAFATAAEGAAKASGSTLRVLESQLERARISAANGHVAEARAMLAVAETLLGTATNVQGNRRTRAALLSVQSELSVDPIERVQLLDRAIAEYRGAGADILLARLFLAKGRAQLARHDEQSARTSFAEGISIFETVRQSLKDTDFRLSYFEDAWSLFDEMMSSYVRTNEFPSALRVAMRARARDIGDRLVPPSSAGALPTPPSIPTGTQVVFYVVLEPMTVAWVLSEEGWAVRTMPVPRVRMQALVGAFHQALGAGAPAEDLRERSMTLHDALVAPLSGLLKRPAPIAVVLDPLLQSIPFGALQHRATARYLIEDYEVSFWPSLAALQHPGASRRDAAPPRTTALVIGDPTRTEDRANVAPALPGARSEAKAVAQIYQRSRSMIGQDAVRADFVREAGEYEVVHFAGHALVNPELPGLSRLLFASTTHGASELHAFEIARQRLARTNVIVLAACETAAGRTYRSEGVMSLARAFVDAGVPDVIATLWNVRDDVSRPLFERLHQHLSRGESVPAALRATQLWSLASADPALRSPSTWAAIVSIRGARPDGNSMGRAVK